MLDTIHMAVFTWSFRKQPFLLQRIVFMFLWCHSISWIDCPSNAPWV